MKNHKSSISRASSYKGMGTFWDRHDATDYLKENPAVRMSFDNASEKTYFALEKGLSRRLQKAAKAHGVSSDTLINMWVQEKLSA